MPFGGGSDDLLVAAVGVAAAAQAHFCFRCRGNIIRSRLAAILVLASRAGRQKRTLRSSSIRRMRRSISRRFVTPITAAGGKESTLVAQVIEKGDHPCV